MQSSITTGFTQVVSQFCWFITCVNHSYLGESLGTFWKPWIKEIQWMAALKWTRSDTCKWRVLFSERKLRVQSEQSEWMIKRGGDDGILLEWCLWHDAAIMTGQHPETVNCCWQMLRHRLMKQVFIGNDINYACWEDDTGGNEINRVLSLICFQNSFDFLFLFTWMTMIKWPLNHVMVKLSRVRMKMLVSFLWNLAVAPGKQKISEVWSLI